MKDHIEFVARRLYVASHPSAPRPGWMELSEDGRRFWAHLAAEAIRAHNEYVSLAGDATHPVDSPLVASMRARGAINEDGAA